MLTIYFFLKKREEIEGKEDMIKGWIKWVSVHIIIITIIFFIGVKRNE